MAGGVAVARVGEGRKSIESGRPKPLRHDVLAIIPLIGLWLPQQPRQFRDIRRNPPRLVAPEQLGDRASGDAPISSMPRDPPGVRRLFSEMLWPPLRNRFSKFHPHARKANHLSASLCVVHALREG